MNSKIFLDDNHIDDHVDTEIRHYLSKGKYNSFFMFAGAGSGKTRSLVNALSYLDNEIGAQLAAHAQQIAVITYTNAACDEISRRLGHKPIFAISTIHSFLWELIKHYQLDIKKWAISSIRADIEVLEEEQAKGRSGDAALKRAEKIQKKTERLAKISEVKKFLYNPNGDNAGYDSLNHEEVIKMGSDFIANSETMQEILVHKFPILLIDESQDTKKDLVDALFVVYEKYKAEFVIGMFGDTMQKIYTDGKENLVNCVPCEWGKPAKVMNHRSAKRIVDLANMIRKPFDGQCQRARSDAKNGTIRLFLIDTNAEKEDIERRVADHMADVTGDRDWLDTNKYKSLILEHHMAASRFNFSELYTPLNESKLFDTSLRDGSISELSFLSHIVMPLVKAYQAENDFEVSRIVRQHSPLIGKMAFLTNNSDQTKQLKVAESAVEDLMSDLPPVIVPNPMLGIPIWGGVSLAPLDCIVPLGGVAVKGGAAVQFTLDGQAAERYSPSKRRKG